QHDWLIKIPIVEFALNCSISETTGFAPFELNYGYVPSMLFEVHTQESLPAGIGAFGIQAMQNLFDAHDAIIEARVWQTYQANKHRSVEPI
ncbi:hypothetical protein K435DRAFT_583437, partial [Dendrothele bispora CBS 962.96]